jgi:hypothetical protein
MIKRIIVCDVCGKEEQLDVTWRDMWYREDGCEQICSEECFKKHYYTPIDVDSVEMDQIKSDKRLLKKLKAGHLDARRKRGTDESN